MTSVRLRHTRDAALWDRLVRDLPHHTQFHTWDWLDLIEPLLRVRVDRLLVVAGDVPVGVMPIARGLGPAFVARGMPFPYFGPLVPEPLATETLHAFRSWQLRHGVALAVFDLPPGFSDPAVLTASGASVTRSSTIVVDLPDDPDVLVDQYSAMRRRTLRRAERAGVVVRRSRPGEVVALLDGVLDQAYEAHHVRSPYPTGSGQVIEDWMAGRDDVVALTALVQDEPAGVHLVLTGGPVSLSWLVACDRRFRDIGPNAVLYHEALGESIRLGFTQMDLVGRVDDGVARFKSSFGGVEVPYLSADVFLGSPSLRRSAKRLRALIGAAAGRSGGRQPERVGAPV